jgi:Domain of unknown function (DUF3859)
MFMRACSLVTLVPILSLLGACAPTCDIGRAGTFQSIVQNQVKAQGASDGRLRPLARSILVGEASTVDAKLNTGFGFEYTIVGVSMRKNLTATVIQPKVEGEKGATAHRSTIPWNIDNRAIIYWFDDEQDLKPGHWTLRVEYEGESICEKTFQVATK